jgi:hypothetical protein
MQKEVSYGATYRTVQHEPQAKTHKGKALVLLLHISMGAAQTPAWTHAPTYSRQLAKPQRVLHQLLR